MTSLKPFSSQDETGVIVHPSQASALSDLAIYAGADGDEYRTMATGTGGWFACVRAGGRGPWRYLGR